MSEHGEIRVMIVDDSVVLRGLVAQALETDPLVQIVEKASNGQEAPERLASRDVEMPVMDGITALPPITQRFPQIIPPKVDPSNVGTETPRSENNDLPPARSNDPESRPAAQSIRTRTTPVRSCLFVYQVRRWHEPR